MKYIITTLLLLIGLNGYGQDVKVTSRVSYDRRGILYKADTPFVRYHWYGEYRVVKGARYNSGGGWYPTKGKADSTIKHKISQSIKRLNSQ